MKTKRNDIKIRNWSVWWTPSRGVSRLGVLSRGLVGRVEHARGVFLHAKFPTLFYTPSPPCLHSLFTPCLQYPLYNVLHEPNPQPNLHLSLPVAILAQAIFGVEELPHFSKDHPRLVAQSLKPFTRGIPPFEDVLRVGLQISPASRASATDMLNLRFFNMRLDTTKEAIQDFQIYQGGARGFCVPAHASVQ